MSLKSRLVCVRELQPGDEVSYGGTFRAKERRLIGIVPIGYADGYRRALSDQAHMLCQGQRVPVIGRICMDYTMIDVTGTHDIRGIRGTGDGDRDGGRFARPAAVGDEVVVCGAQGGLSIWLDELADQLNTISYELMTGIADRVPRKFIDE